jgi:hypothetical protein
MQGLTGESLYSGSHHATHHAASGAFGNQMVSHVKPGGLCAYNGYQQAQAVTSQQNRHHQADAIRAANSTYRELGGYY